MTAEKTADLCTSCRLPDDCRAVGCLKVPQPLTAGDFAWDAQQVTHSDYGRGPGKPAAQFRRKIEERRNAR